MEEKGTTSSIREVEHEQIHYSTNKGQTQHRQVCNILFGYKFRGLLINSNNTILYKIYPRKDMLQIM